MSESALDGVTVLELCSLVAGPYCAKLLADMGADVIKLEPPDKGDEARRREPFFGDQPGTDTSLLFIYLNSNKKGVTLDIHSPTGRELLVELVKRADLLIEDLPPSTANKLGLDYPSLHQENPSLVVTSITPFGRTGPYKDYKAYYLNTYHSGGDAHQLPGGRLADELYRDREPIKAGGYLGEYEVGLSASVASMGALIGRMMDNQGRHIDVSKQETLINLNYADFCAYHNKGIKFNRRGLRFPYYIGGLYRCRDGFWELLIPSQRQWDALVEFMGNPTWAKEKKYATQESRIVHSGDVDEKIETWAMAHTRQEIYDGLQECGCSVGLVYSIDEVLNDRQMEYRGYYIDVEHPIAGKFKSPSAACNFPTTPVAVRRPAPLLGQHNAEIYGGWLGYDGQGLGQLRQAGII